MCARPPALSANICTTRTRTRLRPCSLARLLACSLASRPSNKPYPPSALRPALHALIPSPSSTQSSSTQCSCTQCSFRFDPVPGSSEAERKSTSRPGSPRGSTDSVTGGGERVDRGERAERDSRGTMESIKSVGLDDAKANTLGFQKRIEQVSYGNQRNSTGRSTLHDTNSRHVTPRRTTSRHVTSRHIPPHPTL